MQKQVFYLRNSQIKQNLKQYIDTLQLNPDKPLSVTIQEPTRTLDQNARLWATLRDISDQVIWHGRNLNSEQWKHIFTAALKKQEVVPNLKGDGFVVLGQSTSKMKVGEMRDLIELMNAFGAEHGVSWSEDSRLAIEWAARYGDKNKVA
ncbi:recombination protein NinB [Serratia sp. UGAL515B_01]|uniref:recombination protein NinB n=1 Tax=Serratia sp. UGAL515B_01 TaxID=2986763 RepID=UPI002952D795|nr:recombination protein NinB [Serratia sp. UGAL515B_01]WON77559.1 recombination protein NinB [Serratia sp. UGAL515B_01]